MFKLSLALGKTVHELRTSLSFYELVQWMQYYELEPWGSEVDGLRHAVTASSAANAGLMVASPKQLKRKPYKPKDFFVGLFRKKKESKGKGSLEEKFHKLGKALSSIRYGDKKW